MTPAPTIDLSSFASVADALRRGDFSALAPLFEVSPASPSRLSSWLAEGQFATDRGALNEALACACFNGRTAWVDVLLAAGADLVAGAGTGMNGFHWAANRGHLATVQLLLQRGMPLEVHNAYGGTVLGCTVWSAVHERRPGQQTVELEAVVEALLAAGADPFAAEYPSGHGGIDEALGRYRGQG